MARPFWRDWFIVIQQKGHHLQLGANEHTSWIPCGRFWSSQRPSECHQWRFASDLRTKISPLLGDQGDDDHEGRRSNTGAQVEVALVAYVECLARLGSNRYDSHRHRNANNQLRPSTSSFQGMITQHPGTSSCRSSDRPSRSGLSGACEDSIAESGELSAKIQAKPLFQLSRCLRNGTSSIMVLGE